MIKKRAAYTANDIPCFLAEGLLWTENMHFSIEALRFRGVEVKGYSRDKDFFTDGFVILSPDNERFYNDLLLSKAEERKLFKHLSGQHDQSTHGRGGSGFEIFENDTQNPPKNQD